MYMHMYTIVRDSINETQLPWLQTVIHHTGLVKVNVTQCVGFLPIPGLISCAGVIRSGCIPCHVHITLMTGLKNVQYTSSSYIAVYHGICVLVHGLGTVNPVLCG